VVVVATRAGCTFANIARVVQRARRLSRTEWLDLLGAAPRLVFVWASLPVLGIARTRRLLGSLPQRTRDEPPDPAAWRRRALALRRVAARLPGCRCLARAIALGSWLDRRGQTNRVLIGVGGSGTTLRSHAWVEIDGRVVDDTPENVRRFRAITAI